VHRNEIDRVGQCPGRVGKERPVVIGGHRLRDAAAHVSDPRNHGGNRYRVERPAHHGLIAHADSQDNVAEVVGKRHAAFDFRPIEGIRAVLDIDAQHHPDVESIVPNHLKHLTGHHVRTVEQTDEAEVARQQQVEVLPDLRCGDQFGIAVEGAKR